MLNLTPIIDAAGQTRTGFELLKQD